MEKRLTQRTCGPKDQGKAVNYKFVPLACRSKESLASRSCGPTEQCRKGPGFPLRRSRELMRPFRTRGLRGISPPAVANTEGPPPSCAPLPGMTGRTRYDRALRPVPFRTGSSWGSYRHQGASSRGPEIGAPLRVLRRSEAGLTITQRRPRGPEPESSGKRPSCWPGSR